jgi:hypothetical protein
MYLEIQWDRGHRFGTCKMWPDEFCKKKRPEWPDEFIKSDQGDQVSLLKSDQMILQKSDQGDQTSLLKSDKGY